MEDGGYLIKVTDLTDEEKDNFGILFQGYEFIIMMPNDQDGYSLYYMSSEEDILRCKKHYRDMKINEILK